MITFYKGEDFTLTFTSAQDISGYTKSVSYFTPFGTPVLAVVTPINNFSFSAKFASTDTATLKAGALNVVVTFTDANNNKSISKAMPAQILDSLTNGNIRTADIPSTSLEIVFEQNTIALDINFVGLTNAQTTAIDNAEQITNKTSDIASNLTSTDKYPTTKGVNDFVQNNVIEQARSQNINKVPSSKLLDDQLNAQQVELNKEIAFRENTGNNIIYDPYFKYGIMLTTVDPQIVAFGGGNTISLANGEAICSSSITTAKGMQIMARFTQGWATKYGLKAGDTIKVGAYIKAVVGSGANVTNYGTYGRNDLPASQITYTFNRIYLPLTSYTDWQWVENTLTLKTDGTDINQATDFSLAYLQVTDPNASTTPTELHIKQPCILFNPPASATGFFESKRAQTIDYLFSSISSIPLIINSLTVNGDLTVNGNSFLNNLIFNGGQVESTFLSVITEQLKTRWIALSDNQCFPSVGAFLGLKNGTDLFLCVNGVETKLN